MLYEYHNIPALIDPIAFTIGSFSIRWYSLMYPAGFIIILGILRWRIKNEKTTFSWDEILDVLIYSFLGALLGGRLGYVLFYDLGYYLKNPLEIIFPIQVIGNKLQITGFYGMSYFGAVMGAAVIFYFFSKKLKTDSNAVITICTASSSVIQNLVIK